MLPAPCLSIAAAETGVCTFAPGASNPRITEYHAHTNILGYDEKASWCSSFVNWALVQAGIQVTGSTLASANGPYQEQRRIAEDFQFQPTQPE
jgi:hypothetical protein